MTGAPNDRNPAAPASANGAEENRTQAGNPHADDRAEAARTQDAKPRRGRMRGTLRLPAFRYEREPIVRPIVHRGRLLGCVVEKRHGYETVTLNQACLGLFNTATAAMHALVAETDPGQLCK